METKEIVLCMGSSCYSRGNNQSAQEIMSFLEEKGLSEQIHFRGELCSCQCKNGPNLKIGDEVFHQVDKTNVASILSKHL